MRFAWLGLALLTTLAACSGTPEERDASTDSPLPDVVDARTDASDASDERADVSDGSADASDARADVTDASADATDASADVTDASADASDASDASADVTDAARDVSPVDVVDVVTDTPRTDATVDVATDVVTDAASDAVTDAPRPDASVDVGNDTPAADAVTDAGVALVPVRYADVPSTIADCAIAATDPRREAQETRCDGVDNDCDGNIDMLVPSGANACTTSDRGVCASGWASCQGTTRVCQTPSASPEVRDGLDNDCNGAVDDVAATAVVRPRAFMFIPDDLWLDGPDEIDTVASIMEQWGIPYDRPAMGASRAAQLAMIPGNYSVVLVPGYLGDYEFDATSRAALEDFARQGGVVIVQKPLVTATGDQLLGFLGLTRSGRRLDVTDVRFVASAPITRSLDSPEERSLRITDDTTRDPSEVYTFDVAAGTTVLARAYAGAADAGATITRRVVGRGAVYAIGHNLHAFPHYRCYINCFEPAGDVLGLMLRDAVRESAGGHVVFKHTVPGAQDSLLLVTHDIDAPDSSQPGSWGAAAASQMAAVEYAHRARGTYFVTTDYVNGYWTPETVRYLCALGMCPPGAHSVTHRDERPALMGTCAETFATYTPVMTSATTLCGEVRVSLELLTGVTGARPLAWRSPYLSIAPALYDVLASNGILADSSYAIGDFKTNLPISLARTGINQATFRRHAMFEHLIAIEDGMGTTDGTTTTREELQMSNYARFASLWTYAALRNAANGAHTVALVHPSWGVGVPETNQGVKFTAVDRLLTMAERAGIRTDLGVPEVADFWRAREGVALDVSYDSAAGYRGSVTVGAYPVSNLTLEFGDAVTAFTCDTCGPYTITGRRVVLRGPIAARVRSTFTAR
ncbi:MAG: MopE-related protein [Polyangiales bacterium]